MDRPLSIAGRIIYKEDDVYKKKIINIEEPICVIPSEAIHQNDSANTNLDLNSQIDLIPIISLNQEHDIIKTILQKYIKLSEKNKICDYDLFLYTKDRPMLIGADYCKNSRCYKKNKIETHKIYNIDGKKKLRKESCHYLILD